MKKHLRFLVTSLSVLSLSLLPATARAQVVELPVDGTTPVATTPAPTPTPTVPDTGIAPRSHRLTTGSLIFLGGSALGAMVGFSVVSLRKKSRTDKC